MKTVKPHISEKQRLSNFLTNCVVVTISSIYFGLRLGNEAYHMPEEERDLFNVVVSFSGGGYAKWYALFPSNPTYVGIGLLAAFVMCAILFNEYMRVKGTVEDAHGDSYFEEDYHQYNKEFVCDPALVKAKGLKKDVKPLKKTKIKWLQHLFIKVAVFKRRFRKPSVKKPTFVRNEEGKLVCEAITKDKHRKLVEYCKDFAQIYTNEIYLSLNGNWCQRNSNAIVFGASGTGKSRYFLKPNILQGNTSIVITDPSSDVMQSTGYFLEKKAGYKVKCFNIDDMTKSLRFNPLYYIRDTKDIAIIVNCFLENVDGEKKKSSSGDGDFWLKASTALLCACIGYTVEVCPIESRNFSNVLDIIRLDGRSENDDNTSETAFDELFIRLGEANPASYAYQQYKIFRQAPAKTRLNILISTSVNLSQMDIPEVRNLTYKDEMELDRLSEEKMAIFLCIPQADTTYCWLTAMFYSILFKRLYSKGEQRMRDEGLNDPQLKVPVRFFIDECRNIGKIPNLSIYLATCRKYRISIVPIFQNYSQVEEVYGEKGANSIISNCDAFLFLGGSDEATLKIITSHLGKETVKTLSMNSALLFARGQNSTSKQLSAKELMTRVQVETMSNNECLLFIRALRPFRTKKFVLENHKNYKFLAEGSQGEIYINQIESNYEDEEIEGLRIKAVGEDGYIEPTVVDSARRRNLIIENRKKAKLIRANIDKLNQIIAASSNEKEKKAARIGISMELNKLKAFARIDHELDFSPKDLGFADTLEFSDETKTEECDIGDNYKVKTSDETIENVVTANPIDSFADPDVMYDLDLVVEDNDLEER